MGFLKNTRYFFIAVFIFLPVFLYPQDNTIYNLLLSGTIKELRDACRERGISDKGSLLNVRRRLIDYEKKENSKDIVFNKEFLTEKNIYLKNADYLKMYKDENGDEILFLFGNVHVIYDNRDIYADVVRINTKKKIIMGSGNIKYSDSSGVYYAERFYYNEETDKGIFFRAKTKLGNFVYRGSNLKKLSNENKYIGDNISLTTCEMKDPHYIVKADKLYYFDSSYILIKNMKLFFGQDDLLELPYFFKNLQESSAKTSVFFRKRSGIVVQNSYYPIKKDDKYLLLMGDFYERLGIYCGGRWYNTQENQKTDILASLALSKNIYYYEDVPENWSPLGPPSSNNYSISKELRYHINAYKKKIWNNNQLELNLGWIKDPYYVYDFERRSQEFNVMKLVSEAEDDYPRKDSGFSWFLKDNLSLGNLSLTVDNRVNYVPQRNLSEQLSYLPDYYEYRLYSAILPMVSIKYSMNIFQNSTIGLIRDSDYSAFGNYSNSYYFNENGKQSKEIHTGYGTTEVQNKYSINNFFRVEYGVGIGFNAQYHINPTSDEKTNDSQNTLAFTSFNNSLVFGPENIFFRTDYNIKYKVAGSRDYYQYGNFRENSLSFETYLNFWKIENSCKTTYDLKPIYDWDNNRYKSIKLSLERFSPLINTTVFEPVTSIKITNNLIYDIAYTSFKINNFTLNYNNKNINFLGRDFSINWDISWNHNFSDPIVDSLTSSFSMECELLPYVDVYFGFYSRNDSIWKYIPSVAKKNGVKTLNPVVDLLKSFDFLNREDRKESNFKLKAVNFGLIHDLHEWVLKFDYTGRREISYDKNRYVWNNIYTISIGLTKIKDVNFNTQFYNIR